MASKLVAILGASGDGKTTSTIINTDGTFNLDDYSGMNPKSHVILNLDKKALPFPAGMWGKEQKNCFSPNNFDEIRKTLMWCKEQSNVKSVCIDTINIYLAMKEFNERKKMTFDKWADYAIA